MHLAIRVLVGVLGPRITENSAGFAVNSYRIEEAFSRWVRETPEAVAVVAPGPAAGDQAVTLTYRQLSERARLLAARLRSMGLRRGGFVALKPGGRLDAIVAMLATLEAGGTYVPLDPAEPQSRLNLLLEDLGSPILITDRQALTEEDARRSVPLLVDGDSFAGGEGHHGAGTTNDAGTAEDPAYVMFTSGSTGTPKGVVVPHRGVVRLARGGFIPLAQDSVILQLAPLSFDASTFEIWCALLNGGRCVLYPGCGVPRFDTLRRVVQQEGVTAVWLTASLFNVIVDQEPSCLAGVRYVLTGGEALSPAHVRRALELLPEVRLINGYGPTENTTFTCCYRIPRSPIASTSVPIGTPIAGTYVHVMDDAMRPVGDGEVGELCAGGDGLALGYLNRPELTREKFVPDPLNAGHTLYRTGDRVRRREDGNIEFLGRVDDQVKLRGHRIELVEIASHLRQSPQVADALVVMRPDRDGDPQLVAYFTPADGGRPTSGELFDFLQARLPGYMIPSHFVGLDAIPLTANGKADRNALPAPNASRPELATDYVAPRDRMEAIVAKHWCDLLGLERVGIHDRFFEVGGSSVKALQLIPRLEDELKTEIPVVLLFQAATVAEIAGCLLSEHGVSQPSGGDTHAGERVGGIGALHEIHGHDARSANRREELLARRRARRQRGRAR